MAGLMGRTDEARLSEERIEEEKACVEEEKRKGRDSEEGGLTGEEEERSESSTGSAGDRDDEYAPPVDGTYLSDSFEEFVEEDVGVEAEEEEFGVSCEVEHEVEEKIDVLLDPSQRPPLQYTVALEQPTTTTGAMDQPLLVGEQRRQRRILSATSRKKAMQKPPLTVADSNTGMESSSSTRRRSRDATRIAGRQASPVAHESAEAIRLASELHSKIESLTLLQRRSLLKIIREMESGAFAAAPEEEEEEEEEEGTHSVDSSPSEDREARRKEKLKVLKRVQSAGRQRQMQQDTQQDVLFRRDPSEADTVDDNNAAAVSPSVDAMEAEMTRESEKATNPCQASPGEEEEEEECDNEDPEELDYAVRIEILSSWASDRGAVGLTLIELLDETRAPIPLSTEEVRVTGGNGDNNNMSLRGRLICGPPRTTSERCMWIGRLPNAGDPPLTIHICQKRDTKQVMKEGVEMNRPRFLRLWNYNKDLRSAIQGVCLAQVSLGKETVWSGEVQKGCGNTTFDFSTLISLDWVEGGEDLPESSSAYESNVHELIYKTSEGEIEEPSVSASMCIGNEKMMTVIEELQASPRNKVTREVVEYDEGGICESASLPSTPERDERSDGQKKEEEGVSKDSVNGMAKDAADEANTEEDVRQGVAQGSVCSGAETSSDGDDDARDQRKADPSLWLGEGEETKKKASEDGEQPEAVLSIKNDISHGRRAEKAAIVATTMKENIVHGDLAEVKSPRKVTSRGSRRERSLVHQSLESLFDFSRVQAGRVGGDSATSEELHLICESIAREVAEEKDELDAYMEETQAETAMAAVNVNEPGDGAAADAFLIPSLPRGKTLQMKIRSTWGDEHYVGLSGIEIFDEEGRLLVLGDPFSQVEAIPHSVCIDEGLDNDPRTPDKLVDGVCATCDDLHVWLAPFNRNLGNSVSITLNETVAISMIRFWNYNKDRFHTSRGVREIEIHLDEEMIFSGELMRAAGTLASSPLYAEPIIFTDDESTLDAIDHFDKGSIALAAEFLTSLSEDEAVDNSLPDVPSSVSSLPQITTETA